MLHQSNTSAHTLYSLHTDRASSLTANLVFRPMANSYLKTFPTAAESQLSFLWQVALARTSSICPALPTSHRTLPVVTLLSVSNPAVKCVALSMIFSQRPLSTRSASAKYPQAPRRCHLSAVQHGFLFRLIAQTCAGATLTSNKAPDPRRSSQTS